jgi:DNA-directed RNA polymerase specialized sigma24 family protein
MRVKHSETDDSKDIDEVLLVLNIVHTVPDTEEVTQGVFYTSWKKAGTFDSSRGSVMGWLTTITRRLAIDRTRSKQYKAQGREPSVDTGIHGKGWE